MLEVLDDDDFETTEQVMGMTPQDVEIDLEPPLQPEETTKPTEDLQPQETDDEYSGSTGSSSDSDVDLVGSEYNEDDNFGSLPDFGKKKPGHKQMLTLDKAWTEPEKEQLKQFALEVNHHETSLQNAWDKEVQEDENLDLLEEDSSEPLNYNAETPNLAQFVKEKVVDTKALDEWEDKISKQEVANEHLLRAKEALEKMKEEKMAEDRKSAVLHMLDDLEEQNRKIRRELRTLRAEIENKDPAEEEESEESELDEHQLIVKAIDNRKNVTEEKMKEELKMLISELQESHDARIRLAKTFGEEMDRMRNIIRQLTEQRPAKQIISGLQRTAENFGDYLSYNYQIFSNKYLD